MTTLTVDLGAAEPPYEQLRAQVAGHIATGALGPGDRLPTIRALAGDLGVATGTVARAYRELESAGLVTTRRRTGTVVAAGVPAADDAVRRAARDLAGLARREGLSEVETIDLVRAALRGAPGPLPGR
ncbi:GntR family transcriptional regulator [Phycicoccus endophyticus]|uniref:GntR family transcriptional regulator n=1 Tax=Phycicoccus endophyticus TaxID=1690220 RepID=A0A7G9R1Q7_9MICO|nr:GntR family transcriptional regulator [Phycicoccus endophyticus]NHI18676.1 GntR family transcriptional regulator [Phycicoccus endophyticus]QNN49532.1 GntR family transcriptional regulator [Phycicoccus endophyticus]GGL37322.1 GntR family transcriptional regulator [Phycicoccus endophyticus]